MNHPNFETLRTVMRETAIDAMPELAPQLAADPTIVQHHLLHELGLQPERHVLSLLNDWPFGTTEAETAKYLQQAAPTESTLRAAQFILKSERYTLVQSASRRQRSLLLDKQPEQASNARYVTGRRLQSSKSITGYKMAHQNMFTKAATDTIADNPWLTPVDDRYSDLYEPFIALRFRTDTVNSPSQNFDAALNGAGLALHITDTAEFLRTHRDTWHLGAEMRTQVAHDLSYLGLAFASQHFEDVRHTSILGLKGSITRLSSGQWIYVRGKQKADPVYHQVVQRSNSLAPTLKCPVHQPERQAPTTDLEYYLHASVAHAADHDLFI